MGCRTIKDFVQMLEKVGWKMVNTLSLLAISLPSSFLFAFTTFTLVYGTPLAVAEQGSAVVLSRLLSDVQKDSYFRML